MEASNDFNKWEFFIKHGTLKVSNVKAWLFYSTPKTQYKINMIPPPISYLDLEAASWSSFV